MANPTNDLRLDAIRKRVERQGSRYGVRWNQIRRDRRDLLAEVDRLRIANANLAITVANQAMRAAGCPLCMASQQMSNKTALRETQGG
jgi:hypothetical protein